MQYQLTFNETQARAMKYVFEVFFRTHMGQMDMLAESLAGMNFTYDASNPNNDKAFSKYIEDRRNANIVLDSAYRIATGDRQRYGLNCKFRTEESAIVEDLWQVIRHQLWLDNESRAEWDVDSREPMPVSHEPLAKIERVDEQDNVH